MLTSVAVKRQVLPRLAMPRAMLAVTRGSASWPPRTPGGQPHADTGRQSTRDQHPDTRTRRALLGLSHPAANGQPEAQHCTCHFFLHKLRTCRPTRCRMHTSKPRKPIQSRLHASQRVCDQIVFTRRLRERTTHNFMEVMRRDSWGSTSATRGWRTPGVCLRSTQRPGSPE